MSLIKTYASVNPSDSRMEFRIQDMGQMYKDREGRAGMPHRHDYYIVMLVLRGKGVHTVDFNRYSLSGGQVYFISPGQVHQVRDDEKPEGYVLSFSSRFMAENQIEPCFIDDINLFHDYGESPPLPLEKAQEQQLESYCRQMNEWSHTPVRFRLQGLASLLRLFLISCNNVCSLHGDNLQELQGGGSLLRDYKSLVEAHFKEWHQVSRYAGALHITPDHLNRTVKALIGKTAKEYLQSRITTEARRMLYFSDTSQKEIAYALGFAEPAHFSSFFKKCTGDSPSHFRR
ncbi:helix-turn-helix domain-containing protein [Sinomicrobium soli]|uniref:helix-turn-helix domain-containing protein n=1 Tax=Sinomicrobium sp. N-1-3-6 TaxID=2219864 RepID=UPI000DCC25DF|nr:helix-turn-helix domain-containing protein [Sinomicrobium sp. N-1-3-6]RAV27730.1 AraC family transcriptional regulator [Sinomicrobium sp. N-1-3-6]